MKKKVKLVLLSFIVIILTASTFTSALSINMNKSDKNRKVMINNNNGELPVWYVNNKWVYNFEFNFDYSVLTINGAINNMELRVSEIDDQKDEYTVDITGNLDATLKIAGVIPGGSFTGDVDGYAHFEKSTLALKDFYFESDGSYSGIQTDSVVEGSFSPAFDIFDFPIENSEDQSNPWEAETSATINGEITILDIVTQSFDISGDFTGEELYLEKEDQYTVPAGTFNCLFIHGNTGPKHGGYSNLFYSDEVGYLVDVHEKIVDWSGVTATLDMPLQYTNFNPDNYPPDIPDKPLGEKDVFLGESYSYTTQTTDDEGDNIYYLFDWDDGKDSGWIGPYNSDESVTSSHRWHKQGVYNVKVKARDESGIESPWSDPLAVTVSSENPYVTLFLHKFSNLDMDDIDFDVPLGVDDTIPEWYYKAEAYSSGELVLSKTESNRKGNGDWIHGYVWVPDHEVGFEVASYLVPIRLKLMDYDNGIEGGKDDLADISGCDYPHRNGANDDTGYSGNRGAIYHGIYNLATDELEPYSSNHHDESDYFIKEDGYYTTSGDYPPDNTEDTEDFLSPENDAKAWFDVWDNYDKPVVTADVIDEGKLRKNIGVRFTGSVVAGQPDYVWYWDFDDGFYSNDQNPVHSFENTGSYTVELTLTDDVGYTVSDTIVVNIEENIRPNTPARPRGKSEGKPGTSYTYYSSASDSEEDQLYYKWDFGDGTISSWTGPYKSGEEVSISHIWSSKGTYPIRVKAVDDPNFDGDISDGKESYWSDPFSVSMPKVKNKDYGRENNILMKFFDRFPILSKFL